jgi:lysine 2,3-aminomutase
MLTEPRHPDSIPLWNDATSDQWNDWKWQIAHRITSAAQLEQVVRLTDDEKRTLVDSEGLFRLGITPHAATLIDPEDPDCPMRMQSVPRYGELFTAPWEAEDPLDEDGTSPVPGITHRYPDRILFLLTHECSLYCRFCTRRRIVGDQQGISTKMLDAQIGYVAAHPEVRDVLISGGDPLAVPDSRLEYVISRLRALPHVEIIRIGTRMPVVMPQRITPELVEMLRRYHPIWLNTHFNHPFELAPPATREAMERLADAGIPTGNQTVLLRGINDCPVVMRELVHALVKVRCRPYYIYACDLSEGLSHFRTPISTGVALIEALRGHTSGYCVPTFVVDGPGGGGKIPIMPNYVLSQSEGRVVLRNYQGKSCTYHEGPSIPLKDVCALCGTNHSAVEHGPAAQIWRTAGGEIVKKEEL